MIGKSCRRLKDYFLHDLKMVNIASKNKTELNPTLKLERKKNLINDSTLQRLRD
jgi:hypothetical protein